MSGCSSIATEEPSTKATVNDIFRFYGPAYLKKYGEKMPQDQVKAMMAMIHCRSPEAGTVVYQCSDCGMKHQVPKACGNRNCPSCQGSKARAWLEKQIEQLLPCAYFMITFTVPSEFRSFVRSHPKKCYKAFFDAAYKTMVKLAKDPKYIGSSKLGVTGVLHTWGRDMSYHPHVHFIVPGGAISEDGTSWLPSRSDFFIPVHAASIIFRAKYRAEMKRCGLLHQIPDEVWSKAWIVNSQAVGDGRLSLKYLSPYVFRIAIGNHRIVSVTPGADGQGEVVFLVKRTGTNVYRPMTVSAEEFIRRYLQHVLPRGFQKIRHFGFAHSRSKTNWEWLAMMVTTTLNLIYTLIVSAKPLRARRTLKCCECGGDLEFLGFIRHEPERQSAFNTS
jgi:Putative transposase/Transposase zinc-binding domain